MKTRYSIIIICLLALFATGCKKDNNGRIRIFARNMTSDSKVLVDPSSLDGGSWVAGEFILLYIYDEDNNEEISGSYVIGNDANGFYIDVDPVGEVTSAFYPAGSLDGNDIDVSDAGIVLKRLTINFHPSNSTHDVVFPMMAIPDDDNGNRLFFDHLTAGLKLTLTLEDANSSPVDVASVKIVAKNSSSVSNMSPGVCSWAVQGPTVPSGNIGTIGDQEVSCSSEMNFDFTTEGDPGATVTSSGLSFCIPITIEYLKALTVVGYSAEGAELFRKTKSLTTPIQLECNTMYVLPTIEI